MDPGCCSRSISRARRRSCCIASTDLDATVSELREHGAEIEAEFGFPHGPAVELRHPGRPALAFYELTRPEADERLGGRMDFEPEAPQAS